MNNLPINLIQCINDQLDDYFDQIQFKSISKVFYDHIKI